MTRSSLTRSRALPLAAAVLAVSALTAGCGLKPDATASLKAAGGASQPGTAGIPATGTGPGAPSGPGGLPGTVPTTATGGAAGGAVVPGSAGGSGSGGPGATGGAGGTGGVTAGGAVACGTPHGGTTTGITASTINIGLHAPLTGTGTPFPNNSFQAGAGTFWKQPGHTVCGRRVAVEFQDDEYTPAHAHQVCSAMAKRDFLVVGGGGTDQIQACATDPVVHQTMTPYLSAGVTDNGLTGLPNYFAVSLTYQQQGTLVLRNAQNHGFALPADSKAPADNIKGAKAKWAIVTANTPNFAGARKGMESALTAAHIPYKDFQVDQNGDYKSAATQFGQQLAQQGFKTVFVDAAPGYFVFMVAGFYTVPTAAAEWVGPGVTYTEVTVAQYVCDTSKGAISGHAWFLAPGPGLDHATPDFKAAYNNSYDDIEWSLWGLSQALWALLKDASTNLTRDNFIASTTRARVTGGIYAPIDYGAHGGHFGGTGAWVQRVDCGSTEPNQNQVGSWDTVGTSYLSLF